MIIAAVICICIKRRLGIIFYLKYEFQDVLWREIVIYTVGKCAIGKALVEMLSSDFTFYLKMPQVRKTGEQNL